ncbi:Mannosyl oligosaccharide glucosidase [Galbibacter orientalis DSM 19592]|uniref:Mannosyl oligosaccharide glucosidase n=1 Tax=Galbibacter orientalis DSM 19592 TaxID=926559 RepID=I3C7Z8_9FLAO|nr:glucosidase [Galbibacter orientalis]EIJ39741.1 Mannosyl oligosaccharide glucosidase [Galbibacter orientalis DSM 19592]
MEIRTKEHERLEENYSEKKDWLKWGPYLSERQWGTVREDYSSNGDAWGYFTHDHARSRAYRWGEDGIAGISDRYCNICFGITLWNGKDSILKERLFGLTGPEGNHGEDVKELYYYLENTPSHSYMKHLYKYPQEEFPYDKIVEENRKRGLNEREYKILDTDAFKGDKYFNVETEYAKADNEDLLIKITIENVAKTQADLHLLPTLWIRNYWSFVGIKEKPFIKKQTANGMDYVAVKNIYVGSYNLYFEEADFLFFTKNETNEEAVYLRKNDHPYKKDLFHTSLVNDNVSLPTSIEEGTKFAPVYKLNFQGGETKTIKLRLSAQEHSQPFDEQFEEIFNRRIEECNEFYNAITNGSTNERKAIQRQAYSGLLWTKQYYNYDVETWLEGDSDVSIPPVERLSGRNSNWKTLRNHDIMSMPDKWEYPWYASWDSAFHCISLAKIDPEFAKNQLILFTREWYMAPNGQIPAYEWSFSDVNPPVQAWAAMKVYKIDKEQKGVGDIKFLKRILNKLALNFTWWVNRLDSSNNNIFEGGFLGLDNIGVFDRSYGVPGNGKLEQVDGTSWMALYCLSMLEISLEISLQDNSYEDMTIKYFGHFVFIAEALNNININSQGTWDEEEGFFYDKLTLPSGESTLIKVRSIAGLLSMAAVLNIKKEVIEKLPKFERSINWFKRYRKNTLKYPVIQSFVDGEDLLLSLVPQDRLLILMKSFLDEKEFLSDYGIRSLSKAHEKPYHISIENIDYSINYESGESTVHLFGGNSNWRGPIWMPINFLFIQALKEYQSHKMGSLSFEFPTGSGQKKELSEIILNLSERLINMFEKDSNGNRPINSNHPEKYKEAMFKDLILFYEYFDGDNGRGLGASHQTGWTSLVANLIDDIS